MKRVLVVVDYQVDLVSGKLGFRDAINLEKKIKSKIEDYKGSNDPVVYILDCHGNDYFDTEEGKHQKKRHCVKGTIGWCLYGAINDLWEPTDVAFNKETFGSIDLSDYLRSKGYDLVELVGISSNTGILSNAIIAKSALPKAKVLVDATCTASKDRTINEEAFDIMQSAQIEVINREKIF